MEITLADRIKSGFSRIKIKKTQIKVPKLKIKKGPIKQKIVAEIPTSAIINILIKNASEKLKKEKKATISLTENKEYKILKREGEQAVGYGAASNGYGIPPPTSSYVDYGKIFSYLGRFRAQSSYNNIDESSSMVKTPSESSFVLADKEAIDKAARFEKYMKHPGMAIQTIALSLVPVGGLSSAEWEEVKMMMKLDPIMYSLKTTIS